MEIDKQTLKFQGFDALEDYIKTLTIGKKFKLFFVQAIASMSKKKQKCQ